MSNYKSQCSCQSLTLRACSGLTTIKNGDPVLLEYINFTPFRWLKCYFAHLIGLWPDPIPGRAWIQIKPDKSLGLIWVQTVCKGYQQVGG